MCSSLILGSLKISLTIFNILHVLVGLCVTAFGGYLQIDYGTYVITIVTLIVGVFITILGCLGICAVTHPKNWCLLTTYSIFMGMLFFINIAILVVAFADYDTFVGSLDSNNSDMNGIKNDIKKGKRGYQILQCVIVLIEFICVWFSLMMRKHDGDILNDGYEEFDESASRDLTLGDDEPINYHNEEDDKVLTTSQKKRQALREKYGLDQKEY
eukprot:UN12921